MSPPSDDGFLVGLACEISLTLRRTMTGGCNGKAAYELLRPSAAAHSATKPALREGKPLASPSQRSRHQTKSTIGGARFGATLTCGSEVEVPPP